MHTRPADGAPNAMQWALAAGVSEPKLRLSQSVQQSWQYIVDRTWTTWEGKHCKKVGPVCPVRTGVETSMLPALLDATMVFTVPDELRSTVDHLFYRLRTVC